MAYSTSNDVILLLHGTRPGMEQLNVAEVLLAVNKYKKAKNTKTATKYRNKLYMLMQKDMSKWVGAGLKEIGWEMKQSERLSIGWDCFCFCLDSFKSKNNIDVLKHFYCYTVFYLRMQRSKWLRDLKLQGGKGKINDILPIITVDFIDSLINSEHGRFKNKNTSDIVCDMEDLHKFREILCDEHKAIFDDALLSMVPERKFRVRNINGCNYQVYCMAKNIYKNIIRFIVGI